MPYITAAGESCRRRVPTREARQDLWWIVSARRLRHPHPSSLELSAVAFDACKYLSEYWQRHHTMPIQQIARSISPHQCPTMPLAKDDKPMTRSTQAGTSNQDNACMWRPERIRARYLAQLESAKDTGWHAAAQLLESEHPHGSPATP